MRVVRLVAGLVLALIVVVIGGLGLYLAVAPPELLRVADGYAAKIVCSNFFLAGRDPQQVLGEDVQAPGNPVLRLVHVDVDKDAGTVTARMLGLFATGTSIYRDGLGCANVPDGRMADAAAISAGAMGQVPPPAAADWPDGEGASAVSPAVKAVLADAKLAGPGMRAMVVIKNGRLIGEAYGPGFDANTPLLGWSMSKTVTGALLGIALAQGKLGLDDAGLFPQWQGDARKDIKLRDLMSMTSGLSFNEDYGDVTDVTRMLYLEPDMAGFAAAQDAVAAPGTKFSYSTGSGVMLSKVLMDRLGAQKKGLQFPREDLFGPLGMRTATFEADEAGTLVGGSYVYASGRDWARFGQFLLQDGVWNGSRLLPEGFVKLMQTPNGLPGGYTRALTWLEGPTETDTVSKGLPKDTFWLEGHDGQSMAIVPSEQLIVVRLGLTPSDLGWGPEELVKAVIAAAG